MPKATKSPSLRAGVQAQAQQHVSGVQVQQVAEALDIHPFMISRWRKEVREGRLRGKHAKISLNTKLVSELKELAQLRQRYALLKEEHELLKKAVRFCSQTTRPRSSPSSTARAKDARSVPPCALRGHARRLLRVEETHEEQAQ